MDYEAGLQMILDVNPLALAGIISDGQRSVVILPEVRIAQGVGVSIIHPVSGYDLWLSGSVDYTIIGYKDVKDNKVRLLTPGGSNEDIFKIARGHLFLVEAKRQDFLSNLISCIPEAVSQAIALLKSANLPEVRFCLSDGQRWIFFLLKLENGTPIYYESARRRFRRYALENSDMPLREIVGLICEWLKPTMTGLFELEE